MKERLGPDTYNNIHPTASQPGRFYGTAKLHKLEEGSKEVDQLPVRPIISNIGTATYKTSKFLAKLLSPLAKSVYSVENTKDFISFTRNLKVGPNQEMVGKNKSDPSSIFYALNFLNKYK